MNSKKSKESKEKSNMKLTRKKDKKQILTKDMVMRHRLKLSLTSVGFHWLVLCVATSYPK